MHGLHWWKALLWLTIFVAILITGAALFVASGIYSVAADVPHLRVTERLIEFGLRRSVALHSLGVKAPDLDDEDMVRLGANHFGLGCEPCHGRTLGSNDPIVGHMFPEPPPLGEAVKTWNVGELFWIVRHGLKFTGMPAWSGQGRDDEVWAVVAFLKRLPNMGESEFRDLVGMEDRALINFGERQHLDRALCASCHGDANTAPASDLVPALRGQSAAYLRRSLVEYAHNVRQSGIMEPIAAALDESAIDELARHYAEIGPAPPSADRSAEPDVVRRGRLIAERGIPEKQIPPCLACHSGHASVQFPALAGLSTEYIAGQLAVFRKGLRNRTAYGAIMTMVAERLTPSAIADVAEYFSSLSVAAASPVRDGEIGQK